MEIESLISSFIAIIAILVAIRSRSVAKESNALSIEANKRSRIGSKVEVFLSLRNTYMDIHKDLPRAAPTTELERKALEKYWYNAFNEWYVTTQVYPEHTLWDEFFKKATKGSLARSHFQNALQHMIDEDVCFGSNELRDAFISDIDDQAKYINPRLQTHS